MLLERKDAELFFKLHWTLMVYVNQRIQVVSDKVFPPEEFGMLSPDVQIKVRDALTANLDLIESFAKENPAHLPADEIDIILSWRDLVAGKFIVFRELKKYTVFLSTSAPTVAYGVLALSKPLDHLIRPPLPVMVQTVLLPFKGKIVYDGLMRSYGISFGPGIRRSMNESFTGAKMRQGIVTSLPMSNEPNEHPKSPKPGPIPGQ